ncbi:pentapeptide repeat-containing protein [Gloeobacter violaceus]|uniref:Gll2892 protein n=1 Tax=Gloeobacter violaceus (strain ATCC 29082 / PCC 7421) TaxID=251221 RepID=Q7NCT4_GLOVI|nr:pentapeptide repeat-containing protein [Gloeobacter violaceus]BAC90833.1 gll2892 [Gloeobacter violaceus PCC 7421]
MAKLEHLKILLCGSAQFSAWRRANGGIRPDLSAADLGGANLGGVDLGGANLGGADLDGADLGGADLGGADLEGANLGGANLSEADLRGANLNWANLNWANLNWADLSGADLNGANLNWAHLNWADLREANLGGAELNRANLREANLGGANLSGVSLSRAFMSGADLRGADLGGANLSEADLGGANLGGANLKGADLGGANLERTSLRGADLRGADLRRTRLTGCSLEGAVLEGCQVYGTAAWDAKIDESTDQRNLVITDVGQPAVSVDNLKIARFLHLLIDNAEIRDAIDAITFKAVLILGRFSPERKPVLDALREALRERDHLPVVFDLATTQNQAATETVRILAGLARFVIADLADGRSVPAELHSIVPDMDSLAFVLIAEEGSRVHGQIEGLMHRSNVVEAVFEYGSPEHLLASLGEGGVVPAEAKSEQLRVNKQVRTRNEGNASLLECGCAES